MENDFLQQASTWGRVFEIAVQRGVIAHLIYRKLLASSHSALIPWADHKVSDITQGVLKSLAVTDPNAKEWIESGIRHLLVFGYGLGWSTMREYLKYNAPKEARIEAIWCPLTLPGVETHFEEDQEQAAIAFHKAFQLNGPPARALVQKGYPGKADFLLWLKSGKRRRKSRKRPDDFLLCLEFSYNTPPKLADFKTEEPHCQEINRYARYLDSRGVFSRVCAEVAGQQLTLSNQLSDHLVAFSGTDKPLYKLCQAASYTERLVHLLTNQGRLQNGCDTRAIAVTSNGLESLSAHFAGCHPEPDPGAHLMANLGSAYRKARKLADDSPDDFKQEIRLVFNKLIRSLPIEFKQQAQQIAQSPDPRGALHFNLTEEVKDFFHADAAAGGRRSDRLAAAHP